MPRIIRTQQVVLQFELRVESIGAVFIRCQMGNRYRVWKNALIRQLARHALQSVIVVIRKSTVSSFRKDSKVRHFLIGNTQQADIPIPFFVGIVFVIIGISKRKVARNFDSVAHIII